MDAASTQLEQSVLALERARNERERAAAAVRIVEFAEAHPDRAVDVAPLMTRLLADKQEELRRMGVRLAALILEPDEAERLLTARLTDASTMVRMEATGQLADLARPSSRGALAGALEDPEFNVRFEAARGMATLKHSAGLDVLLLGLQRGDFRFRALGALGELADARAVEPVRAVFHKWLLNVFERTSAAGVLARLGDAEGGRYLVERTRVRRAPDRPMAIELCGEVQPPGGIARLYEVLADRADPFRGAAARGLGRAKDALAEERLSAVLDESDLDDDELLDLCEGLLLLGSASARDRARGARDRLKSPDAKQELDHMLEDYAG